MLIELYTDFCPKGCENFQRLCQGTEGGVGYEGTPIHRVVKGGWLQGGDVVSGAGNGYHSAFPEQEVFEDECFELHHNRPGVVVRVPARSTTRSTPLARVFSLYHGHVEGCPSTEDFSVAGKLCVDNADAGVCKQGSTFQLLSVLHHIRRGGMDGPVRRPFSNHSPCLCFETHKKKSFLLEEWSSSPFSPCAADGNPFPPSQQV